MKENLRKTIQMDKKKHQALAEKVMSEVPTIEKQQGIKVYAVQIIDNSGTYTYPIKPKSNEKNL